MLQHLLSVRFRLCLVLYHLSTFSSSVLHQFPAVRREQQVDRVVLQVAFALQVGAYQLSNCRAPVCPKKP